MIDWEVIKIVLIVIVIPIATWFIKKIFEHDKKHGKMEIRQAVIESKVDDMREDIKEIKHNVERLIDRK